MWLRSTHCPAMDLRWTRRTCRNGFCTMSTRCQRTTVSEPSLRSQRTSKLCIICFVENISSCLHFRTCYQNWLYNFILKLKLQTDWIDALLDRFSNSLICLVLSKFVVPKQKHTINKILKKETFITLIIFRSIGMYTLGFIYFVLFVFSSFCIYWLNYCIPIFYSVI